MLISKPVNPKLEFTKYNFRNRLPFVIYADFEAISKPCNVNKVETESQTEVKTKKLKYQSPAAVRVLII
jgi:hypothetical protein